MQEKVTVKAYQDGMKFDPYCNDLWEILRVTFPSSPDLNQLQGEQIGEGDHPLVQKEVATEDRQQP